MSSLKRVLIMAGGTGGHVFPGLATAAYLRELGIDVHWLGTAQGIESRLVPEAGIPLHLIKISGLRGKGLKNLLLSPFKVLKAIIDSKRIIDQVNPDVVIGMGGFASGPGGIASWLARRPLVIHEQNAKAGITNKILSKLAARVLSGFPSSFPVKSKVMAIGNPVRADIEGLPDPALRMASTRDSFHLLVLGGSLGAQALNRVVPEALAMLPENERPTVMHQTGDKLFAETKKHYENIGIQANLSPFVKDMAQAYAWADLVVCRAGALTVAELCSAGLGAVFVPFPFAADDHQSANADFMVQKQAAICIQQSDLTAERLADIVKEFNRFPDKRLSMAKSAYALRKVNVVKRIYEICQEVCR